MCLLVVATRCSGEVPLLVGANRDERYDRPTTPIQVLADKDTRVLGGRDELAGGTWLAVNDRGLVAGLTNVPSGGLRDPQKRSRGELPLLLAGHERAEEATRDLALRIDPSEFNPCYLIVADRARAYYLDLSGDELEVRELPPGWVVLENGALGARSVKVERVRELLGDPDDGFEAVARRLPGALADHLVPLPAEHGGRANPATLAACVHTERYGTRSSMIVRVGADPRVVPKVAYADGPPCTSGYRDATGLFTGPV